jgi:hypothetical protein
MCMKILENRVCIKNCLFHDISFIHWRILITVLLIASYSNPVKFFDLNTIHIPQWISANHKTIQDSYSTNIILTKDITHISWWLIPPTIKEVQHINNVYHWLMHRCLLWPHLVLNNILKCSRIYSMLQLPDKCKEGVREKSVWLYSRCQGNKSEDYTN